MGDEARSRILLAGLGMLFLVVALSAPINHDESQYVAAIALMREGLPYRDWPYLQTPLQPLLLSPLSLLPAGWLLVGARLANVAFALLACWALLRLLRGRAPFWAAALAVGGMATTNAFLFGTEVARNDILPTALLALGLWALLPDEPLKPGRAGLAGLAFGLAISAKISFALPVAGAGLWLLWRWRSARWAVPIAALGGVAGLLPCLVLYAIAPEQFVFGVFTYSLEAPQQFWAAVGQADALRTPAKLTEIGIETLKGASAVALLLWLATLRREGPAGRLLDACIAGGLVAAILPDPFFRQYLIPLLPPLFARAALAMPRLSYRLRTLAIAAGAITAGVGASGSLMAVRSAASEGPPIADAVARGRIVAEVTRGGPVATLAPEQVAGSDVRLQPGFAAGPFLFRTSDDLARRTASLTGAPTWQQLGMLDRDPPAAILIGGERKPRPPLFPRGVDAPLEEWALARGYRPQRLPGEGWILWTAPALPISFEPRSIAP